MARVADRSCVRPGCPAPAQASLTFRYASREAWLERLTAEPTPEAYDLCTSHASRTQPPHGWQLRDRRPRDEQQPQEPPPVERDLGGQDTVAVLAAALRAVPESAPAVDPPADPPQTAEDAEAPLQGTDAELGSDVDDPSAGTDVEAPLEESTSPVLEQPRVPRLFPELGDDEPGPEPSPLSGDAPGDGETAGDETAEDEAVEEAEAPAPRPVPAARSRGIAPPAHRSAAAPHGTAFDW